MDSDRLFILYIHGFNSSPASKKAQQFQSYCQQRGDIHIAVPELSYDPEQALNQLQDLIHNADSKVHLLVGSSLGGYYATWLAEKHDCRAALVNPAVSPVKNLGEEFLGPQKNYYSGIEYEFTREYALFLDTLDINPVARPHNFLLMVQKGDEVLDYRHAVKHYEGAVQIVQEGGSHSFEEFDAMFAPMMEFAEQGSLAHETLGAIKLQV